VLSLVVPGAGQMYTGNILSGLLWFFLVAAGYTLILPGLFLHLICIATAAGSAHRLNSSLFHRRHPRRLWAGEPGAFGAPHEVPLHDHWHWPD
jgi:TM2 domain-containing membrane protein YozV